VSLPLDERDVPGQVLLAAVREIRDALPGEGLFYCKRAFLRTGSVPEAIRLLRREQDERR
jgi:hypothetical protein